MGFKVASRVRGLSDEAVREAFGTEEQCRTALVRLRWPGGFVCPCCGHREHCVNTTLDNIKSAITGTYRKLGPDHAGRYLASFAWRYNRRYQLQTMIPRFVHSAARNQPMPYRLLIAG